MLAATEERLKPWSERHECVAIEIQSASGLVPKYKGKPDTYVKIYVPSLVQNTIVKKTRVIKKSYDPEYNDSDTVWMDGVDVLNIEIWEKRVIGGEICIGKVALAKSQLPAGAPSNEGFWSQAVTLPLQAPKDRKTKSGMEPPTKGGSGSGTSLVGQPTGARDSSMTVPTSNDLLETSSEQPTNRGTITFRVNYETRYQEWMTLEPYRGKVFVWGAVQSQAVDQLTLEPSVIQGMDEVLNGSPIRSIAMWNGYFSLLLESGSSIGFGISFQKLSEGDSTCYSGPEEQAPNLPNGEKVMGVSAGVAHLLVPTESGKLYAAGSNCAGELGIGTTSEIPCSDLQRVHGLNHEFVVGADAGHSRSMCWTKSGALYTWGDASLIRMWTPETDWIDGPFDHLAHPDEDEAERDNRDVAPVPKRVCGLDGVKIVKASTNLTISAAISDTGDLYTWGDHHGAGYDTKNLNIQYPQRVQGLPAKIVDVAVGPAFVVALDSDGHLWSWGCLFQKNDNPVAAYPLGLGGERTYQPKRIEIGAKITELTCIGNTIFALDSDAQLWCWGNSQHAECFRGGVIYGRPIKCDFFRDLKVEKMAHGYGTAMCVYTSLN